ncbi:hypothetical protein B0T17DRAFT_534321 [Bombardia bombarda]|uniref:Uncharacterized protein n=1 Tax=Bombardia bombarda TaxID=252184 RepID=A0AA39WTV6_9PEZI|nr:hypothetical protein B0T17DRAFT_534321 [Bombardia bombarda]
MHFPNLHSKHACSQKRRKKERKSLCCQPSCKPHFWRPCSSPSYHIIIDIGGVLVVTGKHADWPRSAKTTHEKIMMKKGKQKTKNKTACLTARRRRQQPPRSPDLDPPPSICHLPSIHPCSIRLLSHTPNLQLLTYEEDTGMYTWIQTVTCPRMYLPQDTFAPPPCITHQRFLQRYDTRTRGDTAYRVPHQATPHNHKVYSKPIHTNTHLPTHYSDTLHTYIPNAYICTSSAPSVCMHVSVILQVLLLKSNRKATTNGPLSNTVTIPTCRQKEESKYPTPWPFAPRHFYATQPGFPHGIASARIGYCSMAGEWVCFVWVM